MTVMIKNSREIPHPTDDIKLKVNSCPLGWKKKINLYHVSHWSKVKQTIEYSLTLLFVLSTFMLLSFIVVTVCGFFEWKQICAGFWSFAYI